MIGDPLHDFHRNEEKKNEVNHMNCETAAVSCALEYKDS